MSGNRQGATAYIPTRDEPVAARAFEHARRAGKPQVRTLNRGYSTEPPGRRQDGQRFILSVAPGLTASEHCSGSRPIRGVLIAPLFASEVFQ